MISQVEATFTGDVNACKMNAFEMAKLLTGRHICMERLQRTNVPSILRYC